MLVRRAADADGADAGSGRSRRRCGENVTQLRMRKMLAGFDDGGGGDPAAAGEQLLVVVVALVVDGGGQRGGRKGGKEIQIRGQIDVQIHVRK